MGLLALQLIDGLGSGAYGVLSVVVVSELTQGSGRFNAMQGVLLASDGAGRAVSSVLGGGLADAVGFELMFLTLAGLAIDQLLKMKAKGLITLQQFLELTKETVRGVARGSGSPPWGNSLNVGNILIQSPGRSSLNIGIYLRLIALLNVGRIC